MLTLSAPALSGYREQFETLEETQTKAAELLGVPTSEMVEELSPDGDRMYCYATREDATEDTDGAYAVQYFGWPK